MKYALNSVFFVLAILCLITVGNSAYAQSIGLDQSDVNMEIVPRNPGPGDEIYVSLTSYTTDINSAKITWKVNGKTVDEGTGKKTFSFTAGNINTVTTLDVLIRTIEGVSIKKTAEIRPASVDLIWESGGFVPPFYKGKTLFAHQDKITFIAIPHIIGSKGAELSANNLLYKWTLNGKVNESASGYGKNTYSFSGPLISRPLEVEVEVSSPSGGTTGYTRTIVSPTDPFIVFYKKDPLYGIEFQNALSGTEDLLSKEMAIIGVPFFFDTTNLYYGLLYKWSINGVPIDNDFSQPIRIFRNNDDTPGTSNIGLSIEHSNKILQFSSLNFNLTFNGSGRQ